MNTRFRNFLIRAAYALGGGAIIAVGVLVPVTGAYLIPLGAGVVGMAIPAFGARPN